MRRLSHLFRRDRVREERQVRRGRSSVRQARQGKLAGQLECLERRSMLAVTVTNAGAAPNQPGGDLIEIVYNQPDTLGNVTTSNQNVVVEIEDVFTIFGDPTTRVSIYASSNALTVPPGGSLPAQVYTFQAVSQISVVVPNYDEPGVNNNSLTIKGILGTADRIIMAGSGRTAAGRWSDETDDEFWVSIETQGIDDLTLTAGGIINVSGLFSNDTNDASIHAIATIPEDSASQLTGTVVIGETTPVDGVLPHPRLQSNFIEMIGAELDILSDIQATNQVILRAGENAPAAARSSLVLPYDITVTGAVVDEVPIPGRLELFSTQNIEQMPSSTILTNHLVAVSNNADVATLNGPWMISLGTESNDFDTISLGMTAAPGDAPNPSTEGRVGIRDADDLTVSDFGILAAMGRVRIDTVGPLTLAAPVQATGLILESDDSVVSSAGAVMRLGDEGISVLTTGSGGTASGDVTLAGPITILDTNPAALVTNKIVAAGTVTITGGLYSPHAGSTTLSGRAGVVIGSAVQVGSTKLDANSTNIECFDHDLTLISLEGGVTVNNVPGNDSTPFAVQATNIIAIDAVDTISIGGSIFAGTIYGDPDSLTVTEALPAISVNGLADVIITTTGSLRTQAYETNPAATANALVGKISITAAERLDANGPITADGAVSVTVIGDAYFQAAVTGRENVVVRTSKGSIDVQGAFSSTGGTYATAPAVGSQRQPNVILDAPLGSIASSGAGTLTAGTVVAGGGTTFGTVTLTAQQQISIGADVNTPGPFRAISKIGTFDLSALLQTNNGNGVSITAGDGIVESDLDFAKIVTPTLSLLNTGAADPVSDIELLARNNQIGDVTATNLSAGGDIRIANNAPLVVAASGLTASRGAAVASTIELASKGGMTQAGPIWADNLVVSNASSDAITLANALNDIEQFAASNPSGNVVFTDADDFETGVQRSGAVSVEVVGDAVTLSSAATKSTIRVVSGLKYRTLTIAAGNLGGSDVGTVEYVTTSTGDNAPVAPGLPVTFAGTLRDMIGYANANTATYLVNGGRRPQPQAMVFDESGYDVASVTVGAIALPAFAKPVTMNGATLTDTILAANPDARLGVLGSATTSAGLTFGVGSSESTVTRLAVGGFTVGSGIVLSSGGTTLTNVWVGLDQDENVAANRIGIDITGAGAVNNVVGSEVVDPITVNRIENNTSAGVVVRNNASGSQIYGNMIRGNGVGVRINGGRGTQVGAPDAVQIDDQPSISNTIAKNLRDGVLIMAANAGSFSTANRVRNNLISDNGTAGVAVVDSKFAIIGEPGVVGSNVIINQAGHGVSVTRSTDLRIRGNDIGLENDFVAGNLGDGIMVAGSQRVDVSFGNRIAGNAGSGVVIAQASSGVNVSDNRIGGDGRGNAVDGVAIRSSIGNTVGALNEITFNGRHGVSMSDSRATSLAAGNRVFGSLIAENAASGVMVSGGSYSTIGGLTTDAANEIRGNVGSGIAMEWNPTTGSPTGYAIQGNLIGTNVNRDVAPIGNGAAGILVSGGTSVVISDSNAVMNNVGSGIVIDGGVANVVAVGASGQGNLISGNGVHGVQVRATAMATMPSTLRAAKNHAIWGNVISENLGNGVTVTGPGTSNVSIGNAVSASGVSRVGNTISGNGGYGVSIGAAAKQVGFQGNAVYENALGAFNLAVGSNPLRAMELKLASAVVRQVGSASELTINATGKGVANQQYSVDVYANSPDDGDYDRVTDPVLNSSGYQARRFLGRVTVTARPDGTFALVNAKITALVEIGEVITITATSLRFNPGSTSGLSTVNVTADLPGIPTPRPPY